MRALAVLLVAVLALVAAQTTTSTTGGGSTTSTTASSTTASVASTTGSPAPPSNNGPSFIAVITTDGCPDWRALLSKAASGSGISPGEIQLYAYLGCLIRETSHRGELQFYVQNDPKGDRAKAAAKALSGSDGVIKTDVRAAPNNIPAPPPKKKKGLSAGAKAGLVVGVIAAFILLTVIGVWARGGSSSSSSSGGDNPNYAKM